MTEPQRRDAGAPDDPVPSPAIRVLVAEDHPAVRAAFVTLLDAADGIEVVGAASDGHAAMALTTTLQPDVVLTDVRMPGATGIEITPRLRAEGARVLVISAFDLDSYVLGALAAGADGYLVKTEEPARIVEAVRQVAAGDAVLSPGTVRAVVSSLQGLQRTWQEHERGTGQEQEDAHIPELTQREEEVLRLLAQGLSNQRIARHLAVEVTTVKTHITHVLAKLQLDSRVQAALWWQRHRV